MKKIVLVLILVLAVGCNGQDKNTSPVIEKEQDTITYYNSYEIQKHIENKVDNKTIVIKKLDITEFKKSKANESRELIKGDSIHRFFETVYETDEYIGKESIKLEENISTYEVYDKKSLTLFRTGQRFFHTPIGIQREYNSKGELIKEKNWDKDFKLSVDDVISLAKEKLNIDINKKTRGLFVSRGFDEDRNKYIYSISLRIDVVFSREVIIDAENGEIIYDEKVYND
ncbi:MAG: hypothetical protein WCY89_04250 [Flavobacteriaceae bacterium]